MAEERKVGSIRISKGKVTIQTKDGAEDFGIDFVARMMLTGVRTSHEGAYKKLIKGYVRDMRAGGLRAVPAVQRKLKTMSADRRPGVRQCCQRWGGLLRNIVMLKNVSTGGQGPSPMKKYTKNYDAIFSSRKAA